MNGVSTITLTENVALITFNKAPSDLKIMSDIFTECANSKINIDMISATAPKGNTMNLSFTVSSNDLITVLELANNFREKNPEIKTMVSSGNCKIQLYGSEMREMYGVAARAISAMANADIEITLITTSEIDISFLVSRVNFDCAVSVLKKEFSL